MDAFLIVDFQNDFTPGGALPVGDGDRIAGPINELLDSFDLVIATRDWHPADHGSFAGVEVDPAKWRGADPPSIWPVHCVAGTPGAELHPDLERAKIDVVIDTGQDPNSQGYSGFQDTRLGELLRERGVDPPLRRRPRDRLLRQEHRARRAARGLRRHRGRGCRARSRTSSRATRERALEEMEGAGARLATSDEILAERV